MRDIIDTIPVVLLEDFMKYDVNEHIENALKFGFSSAGQLNLDALVLMPEVRDMCSADRCHNYGKSWCCPPACGTLEEGSKKLKEYDFGIIVQTTGTKEDDFDFECISETAQRHKDNFYALADFLREAYNKVLPLGAGTCSICKECAYPEPCRFPNKAITSMEAYGLWVSKVCELSSIPYYYGPLTITYTSCYLLKKEY